MKKINYNLFEDLIGTQYTDMKGYAAIDGHFSNSLWELCEDNGLDTEKWLLVGLGFSDGETVGRYGIRVAAYVIEKKEGEDSYDKVAARLEGEGETVVHVKHFMLPYEKLGEYIKRIQIGVFTPMTNHISSITMVEELDI